MGGERTDDLLTETFTREFYCLKCGRWSNSIVHDRCRCKRPSWAILDGIMAGIADRLYALGIVPGKAWCWLKCLDRQTKVYSVRLYVELQEQLRCGVLGELPEGWRYGGERAGFGKGDEGLIIDMLEYVDRRDCQGVLAAKARAKEIAREFEAFLDAADRDLVNALLLLSRG